MNIQRFALQLGNSLATGPRCSQEHLRNTVQRTASSSTTLLQFQIDEMEKSVRFPFSFMFGMPEKRYLLKQRQPLPRMANRVVARDIAQLQSEATPRHSSAMLCI